MTFPAILVLNVHLRHFAALGLDFRQRQACNSRSVIHDSPALRGLRFATVPETTGRVATATCHRIGLFVPESVHLKRHRC